MMNNEIIKVGRMEYPSYVKTPCGNEVVRDMSREIVDSSRDTNNLLASGEIHFYVREHYVDPSTGTYGIESLIRNILKANGSQFPAGVEDTELRGIAVAGSMFSSEIIAKVRETFGADRYPDSTIYQYLWKYAKGIRKVKLSSAEDSSRTCPKPRCKYYAIAD
jgi:hypothetical protein